VPAAQTERAPLGVAPPLAPAHEQPLPRRPAARPAGAAPVLWWPALLTAGILCFVTFYAKGGLNLELMTATEMALTLGAGAVLAGAILVTAAGRPLNGLWPAGLLLAFAILTGLSVVWSVQPDDSWRDAGRMLAYSGVFAAAVMLARLAPARWPAILGGVALAAVVVCSYALLTKVFPGSVGASNPYARLEEPYGYWNAIGLTAAMGVIACMWLGSRRAGHALLSALAYPAMGVLLLTLVLAYSRGALAALAIGLIVWFSVVPLRLRGAAVLIPGALAAGAIAAWDFSKHALSADNVPVAERAAAGHQLGALLLAMIVLLLITGLAVGFTIGRQAPSLAARRNAGAALFAVIVLSLGGFAGALAHSQRGFTGSISHAVDALTNPNAKPPPNTPDRLTAVASVRARYWKEALQIFGAHPALGAGASGYQTARLRYRAETLEVRHAHGFVVQTLADLGLVGLLLALALLVSWMAAAGRATHPFNRRWTGWGAWRGLRAGSRPGWRRCSEPYTPERIGLLSMLSVVVVFGAHSLIDWTWYVPGCALVALLLAGWLAGRGSLAAGPTPALAAGPTPALAAGRAGEAPQRSRAPRRPLMAAVERFGYVRVSLAAAAVVTALLAAWSQWQPQRAEDSRQQALALLARDPRAATEAANAAVSRDPLSAEALMTLANVQRVSGRPALARRTLQRAVRLQPSNPQTWLALGRYDLPTDPRSALQELEAAIYLNPESIAPEALAKEGQAVEIHNAYIQALRAAAVTPPSAVGSGSGRRARGAPGARPALPRLGSLGSLGSQSPRAAR
jgi:O-antigen ligase/polysaccharide polymerase Wzy-like membrane protein/tetratricopeptide repeat protein